MRILHILGFYPEIGGPYAAVKELSKSLYNKGLEVNIFSPLPRSYNLEDLSREIPEYLNVRYFKAGYLSKILPSYSREWESAIKGILPRIDLIHAHGVFNYYTIVASRHCKEIPIIISPRGSIMTDTIRLKGNVKKRLYLNWFGKSILKNVSAIHLSNQYEKEEFMNVFKRNSDEINNKIFIAPNGINLKDYINLPAPGSFKQKHAALKDRKYIVFLGRIDPIKGLDILVESFNKLAAIYDDLYLVVVGPDNKRYGMKVRQWLYNAGLSERSIFTGMLSGRNKLEALVDAEVLVLPSYSENFGIAVIEAMACGTPVVVSNKVGVYREIESNKVGIVVKTDSGSLFLGIKTLLDDEDLRKDLAKNGKKFVEAQYAIDKVADKMIKTYKGLIRNAE